MIRSFFLVAFFSLLFLACGEHDIIKDGFETDDLLSSSNFSSSSFEPSSSSNLSSSLSSSLSSGVLGSSSSNFFSSSSILNSSSIVNSSECDFSKSTYINTTCFYDKTVELSKNMLLGSQAKLIFADDVSLKTDVSKLKIESGAELYFGKNSELSADFGGSLEISGKEEKPVIFAATNRDKSWSGIRVHSATQLVSIEYANLSGATTGIDFGKDGVLKNSKIHGNIDYGIKVSTSFNSGNFSGNSFYSNAYDVKVSLANAVTLGSPSQFEKGLHVVSNETVRDITLPSFTYFVEGIISVLGHLTINAGAHFHFFGNSYVNVLNNGSITAIGTYAEPIIFESADLNSFWGGGDENTAFYFDGRCKEESVFEHFQVLRAKIAFANACPYQVKLSNGDILNHSNDKYYKEIGLSSGGFEINNDNVKSKIYTLE
jgi:hypothetical protein